MKNFILTFLLCAATAFLPLNLSATESVRSPSGHIEVNCNLTINQDPYRPGMRFYYNIFFRGERLVTDSEIGFHLGKGDFLGLDLRLYDIQRYSGCEEFSPVHGSQSKVSIEYNEMTLRLQERAYPFRLLDIIFRVSDEGAAFRMRFPEQSHLKKITIVHERTAFNPARAAESWPLILPSYSSHYEANYQHMPVSDIPVGSIIGLPLLMRSLQNVWFAFTEAGLSEYSGLYLTPSESVSGFLEASLSPGEHSSHPVSGVPPLLTPWRVILIGDTPGQLIESNWILALNEPCALEETGWIRPGKCVWPWWSGRTVGNAGFEGGVNTKTMLHYLEFAAENNIEYLLIDAGWYGAHNSRYENITTTIPDIDLPLIVETARRNNIGLILWLFWECVQDQMQTAFPLYEKWGIAGVKIDYMNRDDQEMVEFYHNVLALAADHHLLVNFHGAYKPTGIRRTYPNLITREGVLGLEWSKWSELCDPEHELTLPFTRMLAGPMDFTPGCFRTVQKEFFDPDKKPPVAMGTVCHQLAMYVIYESPLQMLVDYPESYRNKPGLQFLKKVPTTWDSTVVIDGAVGDFIVMARRSGDDWFLGGMTDWTPRQVDVPLSFLPDTLYTAEIYQERPNVLLDPTGVVNRRVDVDNTRTLTMPMGPGGGFVVHFYPSRGSQLHVN